ncbi:unnamed protein product [Euphydryas editha]|uniref:Uncharacterized protein n=1 Tax=Euphydryas editha TaxID=104508 RepID=A0AAU9TDA3_EUPED|nr:unnamed protein product [Euphydryas editha]
MPRSYIRNASTKNLQRRKQGDMVIGYLDVRYTDAVDGIYTVHLKNDENVQLSTLEEDSCDFNKETNDSATFEQFMNIQQEEEEKEIEEDMTV